MQFRKSRTFVAGLAVKQQQPELALKILDGETTYVTMRHIKLLAWAHTGQFDNVSEMFRTIIKRHKTETKYNPLTSIQVVSVSIYCTIFTHSHMPAINSNYDFFCSMVRSSMILKNVLNYKVQQMIVRIFKKCVIKSNQWN